MRSKVLHKKLTVISVILMALVMIVLISTELFFNKKTEESKAKKNCDLVLLTYEGIDDSYFKLVKEGIERASASMKKQVLCLSAAEYKGSYEDTVKAAIDTKASVVVLPDDSFSEIVYQFQHLYPNTRFLLIGGVPHNADSSDTTTADNVISVVFDEAEAGFYAGYAAVLEGYKRLCFVYEDTLSKSIRYCYGFLQGVEYASEQLNISDTQVRLLHINDNTDRTLIGDKIGKEEELVIVSDLSLLGENQEMVNRCPVMLCGGTRLEEEHVVAIVTNDVVASVNDIIIDFYAENIDGGSVVNVDTHNSRISFVAEDGYFESFTAEIRSKLMNGILRNEITLIGDTTIPVKDLELPHIKVSENY